MYHDEDTEIEIIAMLRDLRRGAEGIPERMNVIVCHPVTKGRVVAVLRDAGVLERFTIRTSPHLGVATVQAVDEAELEAQVARGLEHLEARED